MIVIFPSIAQQTLTFLVGKFNKEYQDEHIVFWRSTDVFCIPFQVPIHWKLLPHEFVILSEGCMHQVTFSICYEIKVHFLSNSCCQMKHTDLSKFFSRWLILRFLRLFTFNFIYENNSFWFKSEFKGHKLLCKFTTKNNPETIDTVLIDYPSTFTNALILDKNYFLSVPSFAMIALGFVKQVST